MEKCEKCEVCGATENLQLHHISYEPEITQCLCVSCHQEVHGHGVGRVSTPKKLKTITIRVDQAKWVGDNYFDLSRFVQAMLDEEMRRREKK